MVCPVNRRLREREPVLDTLGLGERAKSWPGQLSGGQQQQVALARALVHEPKLIVCDEPTSNLDRTAGRHVMEILRREAQAPDRTLVVVTHDERISEFADRIAQMDDGMIVKVSGGAGQEGPS